MPKFPHRNEEGKTSTHTIVLVGNFPPPGHKVLAQPEGSSYLWPCKALPMEPKQKKHAPATTSQLN